MIALDTNYLTLLESQNPIVATTIREEAARRKETLTTTVINFEEQMRGWMSLVAACKTVRKQIDAYRFLMQNLELFCGIAILPYDEQAAAKFQELRKEVRIGTMDLKIAAIVLVNGGTLLTKNAVDFRRVPGLKFEDWLK